MTLIFIEWYIKCVYLLSVSWDYLIINWSPFQEEKHWRSSCCIEGRVSSKNVVCCNFFSTLTTDRLFWITPRISFKSQLIVYNWPIQGRLSMWHSLSNKFAHVNHPQLIWDLPYSYWILLFACWKITCVLWSADFFQNHLFQTIPSGIPS